MGSDGSSVGTSQVCATHARHEFDPDASLFIMPSGSATHRAPGLGGLSKEGR